MVRLENNIILTSAKDVIEYGHWDQIGDWTAELRTKDGRTQLLSIAELNKVYKNHWYFLMRNSKLRFFVRPPTNEELAYPWIDPLFAQILDGTNI